MPVIYFRKGYRDWYQMCCTDPADGSVVAGTNSCMMCKRLILNAGIAKVCIRDTKDTYRVIDTAEWIDDDDSLSGKMGY